MRGQEPFGVALLPFGEHQSGILATAATALGWVVRDSVRASAGPAQTDQIDIDAFLDRGGTLYVVSPSRTMRELASLTAALVDAIAARALEQADASRRACFLHSTRLPTSRRSHRSPHWLRREGNRV